jgi:hypothetical protein
MRFKKGDKVVHYRGRDGRPWVDGVIYTVDKCIGFYHATNCYRYKMEESVGLLRHFVMIEKHMALHCPIKPLKHIKKHGF